MKQTVETTEQVTRETEVTICDKCGLEADDAIPLYRDIERETFENPDLPNVDERPVEFQSHLALMRDPTGRDVRGFKFLLDPGEAFAIERNPDPLVEVCEDCYDEVFAWGDD